ncbi:MAG: tol-pal system protein YbgF [Azonexus sp.]|jgi:tol-pal system protein YbgF|uniref:tol-pal system protein YbgF n=1 Tax=Azonexus sp. TaxID=1872668 RepID=UPI00283869B3|nr:tol-pal system protein YbgF [Azonexus sp.]MDR0776326.1 tol-pal system protein YbgF [Azonexus sp.]
MRRLRIALLLAALGVNHAQAGMFDDEEARRQIVDLRIKAEARAEQMARAQLELQALIQRQADEIAHLRGQVETLSYELETAKKRQQDFYLDLDSRLRRFETPAGSGAGATSGAAAAQAVDTASEEQEYEAALGHFKAGRYKEAAAAFAAFVQKYPAGSLAPNAQYWLGNAWYAQRNCTKAIEAQSVVTTKYADNPKAADAWLAIATCQKELGNPTGAKRSLETVIHGFPGTPAAETAQQRLKK